MPGKDFSPWQSQASTEARELPPAKRTSRSCREKGLHGLFGPLQKPFSCEHLHPVLQISAYYVTIDIDKGE